MRSDAARITLVVMCILLGVPRAGLTQGFQGGLRGAVHDSSGVVPGVEVTITNESTGIKRSVVSNDVGEYAFVAVEPGTYTVRAALQGFKTVTRAGIRIGTQQFLLVDLTLEIGAISESVTVTGQSPIIDTSNASNGDVLDSKTLETLPAPGATPSWSASPCRPSSRRATRSSTASRIRPTPRCCRSAAARAAATTTSLDGVPITDLRNRASANPTIEAIEEVKVQVHTYDAEMGRTGGGVVQRDRQVGHATSFTAAASIRRGRRWGCSRTTSSASCAGEPKPPGPTTTCTAAASADRS